MSNKEKQLTKRVEKLEEAVLNLHFNQKKLLGMLFDGGDEKTSNN